MLWMDIDITTFPTPTLWEWVDRVKGWEKVLRAEIDRRAVEAVDPPTALGLTEKGKERMWEIDPLNPRSTDRGAPPRGTEGGR